MYPKIGSIWVWKENIHNWKPAWKFVIITDIQYAKIIGKPYPHFNIKYQNLAWYEDTFYGSWRLATEQELNEIIIQDIIE